MPSTALPSLQTPPEPLSAHIAEMWALDLSYAFINHGCFGARARTVLEKQWRLRLEFESRPVDWLERHRTELIDKAKIVPGRFLGMNPINFGFVANATAGINAVLRSMHFEPGDELLTTDHVYNAVRQTMKHVASAHSAKYVEAQVPLPLQSPRDVMTSIEKALTRKTKLLVIDHVTSPTALIFPVQPIIQLCKSRSITVLVDGAHAPGMLPLNVEQLGADFYAGNLHKWACAPPGAGFIWARPDRQTGIHPPTISHFWNEGFTSEFNWQATRDISPWLCATDSIEFMQQFDWDRVMRHNHQMATWVQSMLCQKWEVEPASPIDGSMLGSMATVELPAQETLRNRFKEILKLRDVLFTEYRIEVPIVDWGGKWWTRPCCQIYNSPEHFERLAAVVSELVEGA
jgi:isopenicillin-N epimerase